MKNIFLYYPGLVFLLLVQVSCGPQGQEEGLLDEGRALMTEGAVEPAVARKVRFFSIISDSLLKVTCIDLPILSFKEFNPSDLTELKSLLLFLHSIIAEQNIFDFGSF